MKIRQLLSSPKKWTQEYYSYDKDGNRCEPNSKEAVCWCLGGAVLRCYSHKNITQREKIIVKLQKVLNGKLDRVKEHGNPISGWNDFPGRKFEEVKALVDELDI